MLDLTEHNKNTPVSKYIMNLFHKNAIDRAFWSGKPCFEAPRNQFRWLTLLHTRDLDARWYRPITTKENTIYSYTDHSNGNSSMKYGL